MVAVLLCVITCWIWVPRIARTAVSSDEIDADFSRAERDREESFRRRIRPWGYASLGLSVMVPTVLMVSGAVQAVTETLNTHWVLAVCAAVIVMSTTSWLASLVPAVGSRRVLVDVVLATGSWGRWWRDAVLAQGIGVVLTCVAMIGLIGAARLWPTGWWSVVALVAIVVVVVMSLVVPVVIEPMFNRFTPLAEGPLRRELVGLAQRDGVPIQDVLVADASKRTSALNAYVSGLGPTRRVVVHDTLIDREQDDDVVAVVAHELGHVVAHDVWFGTLVGALAAAAGVCALEIAAGIPSVLAFGHCAGASDPAVVGFVITATAWIGLLATPLMNGVSRRIERRADLHCFELIDDPASVVEMHRALALTNIAALEPHPARYAWFASHPTSPERIKAARKFTVSSDLRA
jgi:STE24 endopeptidase